MKKLFLLTIMMMLFSCSDVQNENSTQNKPGDLKNISDQAEWNLDKKSYYMGAIAAFSEMVDYEVRTMALGPAVVEAEMDELIGESEKIAARHHVKLYRDKAFLVSDLFSPKITEGKEVLIIYKGDALERYQALKSEKQRLVKDGLYQGAAREEIARKFGRLLSYPEKTIDKELLD